MVGTKLIALEQINAVSQSAFVACFGGIAEHAPWVAEIAAGKRPFQSRDSMITAFSKAVIEADTERQLSLIRAHPDLATKARLTQDSAKEQAGAGLDTLSDREFSDFTKLNDAYKSRFGFPFIFAVKGATKGQVMQGFKERLLNPIETEHHNAVTQVCRILRFRLEDKVAP